jgi:FkbM family methyltransferase
MRYLLSYKIHGSPAICSVGNTRAVFKTTSSREYARNKTLHGEKDVIADLLQTLDKTDVFYDIGANVGTYTCFAGQHLDEQNVVAYEPHPGNADRLRENVMMNGIQADIRTVALSNETKSSKLTLSGRADEAGVGTHSLSTENDEETIDITLIRGDELTENGDIPTPNVVKIDVEGAEQLVIEGLSSTLEDNQCHTIYCEVHPDRITDFGGSVSELHELLESKGYAVSRFENRSPEYFLKAERNVE